MKILVTGSTGMIGSHLCRALTPSGHQVWALHRETSDLSLIQDLPIERVVGDIRIPESLVPAMADIQVVFHTAAKLGKSTPEQAYAVTVGGTRNVLEAAIRTGVKRVVHTSSVAALGLPIVEGKKPGEIQPPLLIDETHSWNYHPDWWLYGYCKHLAEMEVQAAVARGLDVVIVNPVVVIGSGDINRISGDVILRVARGRLRFSTQGGLNVIHIRDCIDGHIAALNRGKTGERYILGNENITHTEFVNKIAGLASQPPVRIHIPARLVRGLMPVFSILERIHSLPFSVEGIRKLGYHFYYKLSKAENQLGFQAQFSTDKAIRECLDWYQQQGSFSV